MTTIRIVSDWHRRRALDAVSDAPLGHIVSIKEPTRNLEQNAKLWALIEDVRKANPPGFHPATKEVWKCRFMHALDHEIDFDIGLDGKPYPLGTSSSKLSVRQMADLITFIEAFGAQHGVLWSDENSPK